MGRPPARSGRPRSVGAGTPAGARVTLPAASVHQLSLADARRIAVGAQLLDGDRPQALPVVERLTLLQIDPTAAIAPNADLVAWSRARPTGWSATTASAATCSTGTSPAARRSCLRSTA
jgi:hypothetical protein